MKKKIPIIAIILLMTIGCHRQMSVPEEIEDETEESTDTVAAICDETPTSPYESLFQAGLPRTAKYEDGNHDFFIFLHIDKKAENDDDVNITSLYVFDRKTKVLSKLFTTTKPEGYGWIKPVGKKAAKCALSDIHSINEARLFPYDRKLVVSGCYDFRNDFSFIVDLDDKSVLSLPTNQGLVGFTAEEGYVIMQSYAYNNGVDELGEPRGGRHTVLSVFDKNGEFIQSLDLEREERLKK